MILVDTGIFVSAADRDEPRHSDCAELLRTRDDYNNIIELIGRYADLGLGFVDTSIATVAERLNVTTIATLNRRDFAVARPAHCDAFDLIP